MDAFSTFMSKIPPFSAIAEFLQCGRGEQKKVFRLLYIHSIMLQTKILKRSLEKEKKIDIIIAGNYSFDQDSYQI